MIVPEHIPDVQVSESVIVKDLHLAETGLDSQEDSFYIFHRKKKKPTSVSIRLTPAFLHEEYEECST